MTLRTVGSLVGAANGAKDLQAMAANFFVNFRKYANGVGDIRITENSFAVVPVGVAGTADVPRLTFSLIWTETTTWQVTDYLSPDDDSFSEAWGSDNSCGYHIESKDSQREQRLTIDAHCLLMPNEKQVEMMRKWKIESDAAKREKARVAQIEQLKGQIAYLEKVAAA